MGPDGCRCLGAWMPGRHPKDSSLHGWLSGRGRGVAAVGLGWLCVVGDGDTQIWTYRLVLMAVVLIPCGGMASIHWQGSASDDGVEIRVSSPAFLPAVRFRFPRRRSGPHQRPSRRPAPPRARPPPLRRNRRASPCTPAGGAASVPASTRSSSATFHKLEAVLVGLSPSVSVLEIHVSNSTCSHEASNVRSLLRAVTRLAPEKFVLALAGPFRPNSTICIKLPCFHRTTSIVFDSPYLFLRVPSDVEFPTLETFSLLDCMIDHIDDLLSRCPRLRVLRLRRTQFGYDGRNMRVHSASLEELVAENVWIHSVDIVAPSLKQLAMSMHIYVELNVSILAPMVEKISWQCLFAWAPGKIAFAPWCLDRLLLETAEKQGKPHFVTNSCLFLRLISVSAEILLKLKLKTMIPAKLFSRNSLISPDQAEKGTREIEKHMVYAFSILELHLETIGHVFGAFVFHIIGINQIRSAMRSLKVVLWRLKEKEGCPTNCPCDRVNWKTQTIALTALEEMEIYGFIGKDHEFDFLKLVIKSAPMIKRVIVRLSHEVSLSSDGYTKIYNLFRLYSFVECRAYLSSGSRNGKGLEITVSIVIGACLEGDTAKFEWQSILTRSRIGGEDDGW
uniref:F-box/LRR-repeat protein 15/At3g58940/PEG3-like LRR domain-containing protein n=1 Tax=Aegilops tauschii TaxID=37682 RepID=N1QPA2_AEGTA